MRATRAEIVAHIASSIEALYPKPERQRIARQVAAALSGEQESRYIIDPNEIIEIDIEQATKLARAMITRFGMNDEFGMVAFETVSNQYLGGDTALACSAETQTEIDRQVVALIKKQYDKAMTILTENKQKLDKLAQYLYEKETITGEEFMNILNS